MSRAVSPAPPIVGVRQTISPNSRYSTRFSRNSSTTHAITASRQERQIVQSWLDLDDSLPGFTSPLRGLSGVRSNRLSYRPG